MSWIDDVVSRVQTGGIYRMSGIGEIKVVGSINQFGGSRGALFVKCKVLKSESESYEVGSFHELNAEFMF